MVLLAEPYSHELPCRDVHGVDALRDERAVTDDARAGLAQILGQRVRRDDSLIVALADPAACFPGHGGLHGGRLHRLGGLALALGRGCVCVACTLLQLCSVPLPGTDRHAPRAKVVIRVADTQQPP
eukprot:787371-Rhodomonas_salina.2